MALPQLRFKSFTAEWSKRRLDSFLERVSKPVDVVDVQEYVQIGIRSHGKGIFHKEAVTGKELGNKRVFWIVPNALVVNIVFAWERAIAVTSENENGLIASHRFPMYLPKNNLSNVDFLRYMFITNKGQSYLELASPGGAGRNKTLGQSNFAELKIDLPDVEEQTKIASFLSAVDEKIKQLTQKHELLSQYKQGMMQKLFSQQIRFKADDGSEFGEWEEKELKDVANLTSSKRVHLADYVSKGIPFFRGKEITELKSGGFPSDILYISPIQFNEFKEKFGAPKNGEILITAVGTLANTYLINTNYEFYFKDGNLIWLKDIKSNPNFLMILLDAHKNDVLASAIGSTQKALTIANLNKLIFKFPTLEEQTKISNFLFAIDQKIEVVAKQIEQAKQWKKGLLQQMFV